MRIVKDSIIRKNEILDAAEHLFITKGYNETSISDIVKKVQVAKGTFYYYYKSKDEILNEVLLRIINADKKRMELVLKDKSLSPIHKITMLMLAQKAQVGDIKDRITKGFHNPSNAEMKQRATMLAIMHLAPIIASVVQEGTALGIFTTQTPLEDVEMLLAASTIIFDFGMEHQEPDDVIKKQVAFIRNMELILGAKPGSFNESLEAFFTR